MMEPAPPRGALANPLLGGRATPPPPRRKGKGKGAAFDPGFGAAGFSAPKGGAGLGTMLGVFVPTMNTIYGVVVFLRWGWAVGQAGLWTVMLMMAFGHVMALLTCASLSAICTNGEVGPGGAYFIISRALGPEFGGSIGALFYFAQAIALNVAVILTYPCICCIDNH